MVDELYELVLGEHGFVFELRCHNTFNNDKYFRIKNILNSLIIEWQQYDSIPKKAMLAIVELMFFIVGGNRFLSDDDRIKLEDASIEIYELICGLYDKL